MRDLCSARPESPRWVSTIPLTARSRRCRTPDAASRARSSLSIVPILLRPIPAPVDALIAALRQKGFDAYGAFAPSLKAPGVADWLRAHFAAAVRRLRSSTQPPSRRSATTGRHRSMPHPVRCSRSRCRLRAARIGRHRCAVCRRPIWRCMWCCRRSTAACLPASSASSRRARAIPICSFRASCAPARSTSASARRRRAWRAWHQLATNAGAGQATRHRAVELSGPPAPDRACGGARRAGVGRNACWRSRCRPASMSRSRARLGATLGERTLAWSVGDYRAALASLPRIAGRAGKRLGRAGGSTPASWRRISFCRDQVRQGYDRRPARAGRCREPRCRLSRSLTHASPRLCRVLSVAPPAGHRTP